MIYIVLTFLFSCNYENVIYNKYIEIPDEKWNNKNIINFKFFNPDTITKYNVYINIRNTNEYPFRNLYLFITIETPGQDILRDTVNCILANEKGEWYGQTLLGSVFNNVYLYKRNYTFKQKGYYTFKLEQALRVEEVKGIKDVGLKIEKIVN